MKVKLVLFILVSIFLLGVFIGCSKNDDLGSTASNEERKIIHVWHKEAGVKKELFQKYIDAFMIDNPDIEVVVTQTRNDAYKEKLPISFSGNQQPDIFFTWGGSWLQSFVDAGHVMDLTDRISVENHRNTTLVNSVFDNKLYGVPLGLDISFIYYNKQIFEEYGLEIPNTYNELLLVGTVLKENGITPFVLANQPKWPASFYFMYFVDRIGSIQAVEDAVNRTGSFDSSVFVEAGEKLQMLAKDDFFNIGFNGIAYDSGPGRQLFYTGQSAMLLMSNTFVNLMRREAPDFEDKMGIFPFPSVEGGKGDPSSIVGIASPVWSISSKTKYPDESVELVNVLTSQELSQEYANTTGSQSARSDVRSQDPFVQQLEEMTNNAKSIQMVYDQTLPPELIDIHYTTVQELLAQTITPEDAAKAVEEVAKEVYGR